MEPTLITSFSQEGYEQYARAGLESFVKHWPGKIVVYYEQTRPEFDDPKIEWRNLFDDQDCVALCAWTMSVPFLCGDMPDGAFNYHYNLHKFGRKGFAILDSLARDKGHVFWFDADTMMLKDIPQHFLADMLDGVYTCYLGREDAPHSETGFVGWNTGDPANDLFVKAWRSMYVDKTVLALPGFHDCWSYDHLVRNLDVTANNLTPDAVGADVFPQSPIGEYAVHHKGPAKKNGG